MADSVKATAGIQQVLALVSWRDGDAKQHTDQEEDEGGGIDNGLCHEAGVVSPPVPGHQMVVQNAGIASYSPESIRVL
jgi:hypothetical protein